MKPILGKQVQRGMVINEWTPAEHHLTHDGQVEFMARMQARIKAADAARKGDNIKPLKRKA